MRFATQLVLEHVSREDCKNIVVGACSLDALSQNSSITCPSSTYVTSGAVSFSNAPASGTLTVSDCDGNNQIFNAPFTSPQNYNLTGQDADGNGCNVTAVFSADATCTMTNNFTAPICPCNITITNLNIGACIPSTNTYNINGDVTFEMPPATGTLTITVNNGTTTFDTIINSADFSSPLNYSISGIDSDGANTTITATFSADVTCTAAGAYTAPEDCACNAAIGSFNTSDNNATNTDFILCYGDEFNYQSNGDYSVPNDVNANTPANPPTPAINYDPGIGYMIYACPPTPGMTPDAGSPTSDPCVLGLLNAGTGNLLFTNTSNLAVINSYPPATFTNNIVYYVPVTMYDVANGWYSVASEPCYELGPAIAVQYLPEMKFVDAEDCQAGSIMTTLNGGLPEIDATENFSIVPGSLTPANASFDNTTCAEGGTITISGLTNGQNYSYNVIDANKLSYHSVRNVHWH